MTQDKSILVVDDDNYFRGIIVQLFTSHGYEVIEARNCRDAKVQMANYNPMLLICDYRLPDMDGMNLIKEIREAGHNLPIVFISGTFCDARTFSWLRNILKVALVLQKPIMPDLFWQQLEGVLPLRNREVEMQEEAVKTVRDEYQKLLENYPGARDDIEAVVDRSEDAGKLLLELKDMGRKLQVENALNAAKHDYSKHLPGEWEKLAAAVAQFQGEDRNLTFLQEAIGLAHKLRGTAGSLGFGKVGEAAGRLEDLMKMIDVTEPTESEVIWTEIFRYLTEGETAARAAGGLSESADNASLAPSSSRLLALTDEQELKDKVSAVQAKLSVDIVFADSAEEALKSVESDSFDAVLLDLRNQSIESLKQLTLDLRTKSGNGSLPFALYLPDEDAHTDGDLACYGSSAIFASVSTENDFVDGLEKVLEMNDDQKPRVLAVDDDEVLSSFIGSILSPQGISVRTLKEPIHILECLEQVKPDLVILDVMMPGLSGYDVARLLRSEPKWKNLSILFLTSKSTAEGRAAAFNAGADDFLSKPVLTEELITRVKNQLDRKKALQERSEKDERTECMSRNYFLKYLGEDLEEENKTNGCLALLEIDRFEQIGLTHGVFAGDDVISRVGKHIKKRFRADVKRARWGEKTFALLFAGSNQEEASQAVRVLRREIAEMTFRSEKGGEFQVTCTDANAEFPGESDNLNGIVDLVQSRLLAKTKSKEEPVSKS